MSMDRELPRRNSLKNSFGEEERAQEAQRGCFTSVDYHRRNFLGHLRSIRDQPLIPSAGGSELNVWRCVAKRSWSC
uniref:Uncharacterized protein n=1 Tax=Sphaerodactylus townsendi TaxID=933632 RepID=A0ACB8FDM2_9SAUR